MADALKIQVKFLRDFTETHCGGAEAVRGLSTEEFVERFIKPVLSSSKKEIRPEKVCLALHLFDAGYAAYGQTGPLISHAWGAEFMVLIETLESNLGDDAWVWIDFCCHTLLRDTHSQDVAVLSMDVVFWNSEFYSIMRACNGLVLVCDPTEGSLAFSNSNPCTRLWCLFETWAAVQTKSKFTVLFTASAEETMRQDLTRWSAELQKLPVPMDKAKCTSKDDERAIMNQIGEQQEGFNVWVNLTFKEQFFEWLKKFEAPLDDWESMMTQVQESRRSSVVPPISILEVDLSKATKAGNLQEVKSLVEKGSNVNAADSKRNTALHTAAACGHVAVVQFLLEQGAQVLAKNEQGNTPLHSAAANGHQGCAELLIKKGSNLGARNDQGETPLHIASSKGHYHVVGILIGHRASINAQDDWGATPLDLAKTASSQRNTKPVQDLLKTAGGKSGASKCKCSVS
mmetsp:Transcript_23029/g.46560  ORF Transcript_23029/g.46560 Transcript_23029/m.46560 type:complete len:457 (-) Transcript_23029:119-1489(-)